MASKITEVVVYQLKADKVEGYAAIVGVTNDFLKTQPGFINRRILQDHSDPTIFMDIVEWETLPDAQNAMQASQKEPSLLPFFDATQNIIAFSHSIPFH